MPTAMRRSWPRSRAAEKQKALGRSGLAEAVARSLYKLMVYKDEYEVARLYTDGDFLKKLGTQVRGRLQALLPLAPPLFAKRDPVDRRAEEEGDGGWVLPMFRTLAAMKRLRGTKLDLFGYTAERKMERHLIGEYQATIEQVLASLDQNNHAMAVQIGPGAREHARLRPHQGEERVGGQGARSLAARGLHCAGDREVAAE